MIIALATLTLALTSTQPLGLLLVGTSGRGTRGFGCSFLARRALDLLPFQLIFNALGIGHYLPCLHFFQLGKLLHQLFHAELCKLYRNLRIITVSFAAEDHALAVFRMANTLSTAKAGGSRRNRNLQLRPAPAGLARGKKLGDV